jgi:hypothetical protein
MTDLRDAARQALEHVQEFKRRWMAVPPFGNKVNKATREAVTLAHVPVLQLEEDLRAALEQPEQPEQPERAEPVAWVENDGEIVWCDKARATGRNLYTHPPRREPLSEEELDRLWREPMSADWEHREFARAVEAAHGIKEEK